MADDLDGALPARAPGGVEHRLEARDVGEVVMHPLAVMVSFGVRVNARVVVTVRAGRRFTSRRPRGRLGLGTRGRGAGDE